jgi:hypothetical protein
MGGPIERSNRDVLEAQLAALEALLVGGTGLRYQMFGPVVMGVAGTGEFGATLLDIYGSVVVDDEDITPGTWTLRRSRSGSVTAIVTGAASQALAGGVLAQHTFSADDWAEGDVFYFEFSGIETGEYEYPTLYRMGSVSAATVEGKVDLLLVDTAAIIAAVGVVDGKADAILTAVGALSTEDLAALGDLMEAVKAKTDDLGFTGADVKATLDGETVALTDGSLTADKIASNAITDAKIADGAITPGKIASNAITDAKIASNAISAAKIASNAITSAKIAASAIGASQIATDAITGAKVAADAVTKIQAGLPLLKQIPGHNLLRDADGSCESVTGWSAYSGSAPELSTEQVYGGTASLKKVNVASNDGISTSVGGPLVQGATYRVRAKVYNVNAGSTLTVGMYNGKFEEHPSTWSRTQAVGTGTWETVDMLFTPLTTYAVLSLMFRMNGASGTWYVDEVSVTHADPNDLLIPATPRAKSLRDILHKSTAGSYDRSTDSLEAIRDRMDAALGAGWSTQTVESMAATLAQTNLLLRGASVYRTMVVGGFTFWREDSDPLYSAAFAVGGSYSGIVGLTGATVSGPVEIMSAALVVSTSYSMADINITVTLQYKNDLNQWKDFTGWSKTWAQADIQAGRGLILDVPPVAALSIDTFAVRALRFKFTPSEEAGSDVSWYMQTVLHHRLTLS